MVESAVILEARNVVKDFGGVPALRGVSLDVGEGEVVALLGPSGSGKSTFVRCMHQLESINGGSIHLDGDLLGYGEQHGKLRPLAERDIVKQRGRIGMVFQHFNLFPHWTVLRNVAQASITVHGIPRADAEERARQLLRQVGLEEKIDAYPRQLSGGQQQRVAIARALAPSPRLLLFDEPTSALDPELVDEVLSTIRALAGTGQSMVVVTHEMRFAREVADRCVFMAEGQIVEQNSAKDFFDFPQTPRLRQFLGLAEAPIEVTG